MAWDSVAASGTGIDYLEWNQMVSDIKAEWISGSFNAHTSAVNPHGTNLDDILDVSVSTPVADSGLKWDGSQWIQAPLGEANTDVAWSGASDYYGHSSNSTIHFTKESLDDDYQPSGTTPDHLDVTSISTQSLSSNSITTHDIYFDDITVGASTYDNIRQWWNYGNSPGLLSGGTITSGSNVGDDITFDVAEGFGLLRPTDNDYDDLYTIVWSESTGNQVSKGDIKFVGIEYNAGSPQVVIKDTFDYDYDTDFPLGIVANRSGIACIVDKPWQVNDFLTNVMERFDGQGWIIRDDHEGGLILGDTGTRNVTLTAGKLWTRLNEHPITAKDTSDGDTFVKFVPNGVGSWTVSSQTATQWPNSHYNNDGALTAHTNNRYGVLWFYILPKNHQGEISMLYGDVNATSASEAENATPPSSPPDCIGKEGLLVGRIVYREGVDTPIEVQSAFDVIFQAAQAANHSNLTNLDADDHTQYYNDDRISTISSNAVSGQEAKAWLNASGSKYHNAVQFSSNSDVFDSTQYITSSNIKSDYYPSSLGNEVHSWMDNSGSKYSQAYASSQIALYSETYSNESDLTSTLDDNYETSGLMDTHTNTYNHDNYDNIYTWYSNSSNKLSNSYASAQIALYTETYSDENSLTSVLDDNYAPSSDISWAYFSSLADVDVSNPVQGSGLKWNGSHWVVSSVTGGAGGVSNISDLTIDDDKDWNSKGIHNMSYISSTTISGGTIITGEPTQDNHTSTKKYVDDSIEDAGGYTDEQAQDAVGENVGTGLSYDDPTAAISVISYNKISSNASSGQYAKDLLDTSGSKWSQAYASAQIALYSETYTGTVDTANSPVDNDYAKFTDSNTIEGRSYSEVRTDLNVADGADVTADNETYGSESDLTAVLDDNYANSGNYSSHKSNDSAHHNPVTIAGTPNYLTLSTQEITLNKLDINDDTNFTEGTGINLATNTVSVDGYDTISSNAHNAYASAQIALYSETYTGTVDTANSPVDNDFAKFTDSNTIEGRSYSEVRTDLNVADGADVTGDNPPQAHHDSHDPNDGSDALDCAAAGEIVGVTAAAEGTAHTFARSDHTHQIQHSIANNHIVTMDDTDAADNDYAKFTADGLEGRSYSEVLSDLSLDSNLQNLTSAEITQLENINSVTITNGQWGYLGSMTGQPIESETYSSEGDLTTALDNNYAPSGDLSWSSIEGLSDVDTMTPSDNDVLTWDAGTSKWSSQSAGGGGSWTSDGSDIYYDTGEVHIGNVDYGDYNFQVSGDAFISGSFTFIGTTISGLAIPTYNSGAANKAYVDDYGTRTKKFASKPTASDYAGDIIRVRSGSSEDTKVFISVENDANSWEWMQLGISS